MKSRSLALLTTLLILVPKPFHAQYYSARVWVDREELYVSEEFRIYFQVSHRSYVKIISQYSGGSRVVYEGYVDPGTYYVRAHAAEPAGLRTIWLEMYVNGLPVAWEYCIINVLSNEKNTYYREKVLPVMRIEQPGKDCWAAALAMAICYHLRCNRERALTIVMFVHRLFRHLDMDKGPTPFDLWEVEKELERSGFRLFDFDPVYFLSWYSVKEEIDNGGPMVLFLYHYTWDAAHAITIAGYREKIPSHRRYSLLTEPGYVLVLDPSPSQWFVRRYCQEDSSGKWWCKWDIIEDLLLPFKCWDLFKCNMKGFKILYYGKPR